jgi:hypothetical protein
MVSLLLAYSAVRMSAELGYWRGSMHTTGLREVIALVEQLSPEEKLQLIEHVARALQRQPPPPLSWQAAQGLGKEIWAGVDVERYLDDLRQEWER